MLQKHKQPSVEVGLLIILLVISIFAFAYHSENKITGMVSTKVTGNMVKVTGMNTYEIIRLWTTSDGGKKVQIKYGDDFNIYMVKDPTKVTMSDTTIDGSSLDLSKRLVIDDKDTLVKDPSITSIPPTTIQSPTITLTSYKLIESGNVIYVNTQTGEVFSDERGTNLMEGYKYNIASGNIEYNKQSYKIEQFTPLPQTPSPQTTTIQPMSFDEAKSYLQTQGLNVLTGEGLTNVDLQAIKDNIQKLQLQYTMLTSETTYKTETIKLAQSIKELERLNAQTQTQLSAQETLNLQNQLKTTLNTFNTNYANWQTATQNYKSALQVYQDATYNSVQAQIDLNKPITQQKAITYYEMVARGTKTDATLTPDQALTALKASSLDAAKTAVQDIEADKLGATRVQQLIEAKIATSSELKYDPATNQYVYKGQIGDILDIRGTTISVLQSPKPEQTPEQRAQLSQNILNLLPPNIKISYNIDPKTGNIIDQSGFVYSIRPDATSSTGWSPYKVGAPDSIFINGVELKRLENYEVSPAQTGVIQGSGVYRGSDGILYDQRGIQIPENTEVSLTANKGSKENPVYIKTYFNVDSGGRQGGETRIKIAGRDNSNPIELSQEVYKRLGIGENDKLQYSGDILEIRNQDNQLKVSVHQATSGFMETKIITGYNKEGKNPTTETLIQFENGVNKPATIERVKQYKYGYDTNKDGKIEGNEKDIRLTTSDVAIIKKNSNRMDDLKVITEYSVENGIEKQSKATVYDINGKPIGYGEDYNKDGIITPNEMYGKDMNGNDVIQNTEAKNRLETLQSQWESRKWFYDFRFRLTQFQGLSGWSQFMFSDEELADWREGVDKLFSTLYLGTEYWVSEICSKDIPKQKRGMFMMETNDGLFDVIAHVEGEKTAIPGPDKTEYIYKLTLAVRNPKNSRYEKLKFNVYLVRDKEVQLYPQYLEVEDGDSFTRGEGQREGEKVTYDKQHGPPIVQYSPYNYNQICIRFEQDIINAKGEPQREICNKIVEYRGPTTGYQQPATTGESRGTSGTSGDPYQESDF